MPLVWWFGCQVNSRDFCSAQSRLMSLSREMREAQPEGVARCPKIAFQVRQVGDLGGKDSGFNAAVKSVILRAPPAELSRVPSLAEVFRFNVATGLADPLGRARFGGS